MKDKESESSIDDLEKVLKKIDLTPTQAEKDQLEMIVFMEKSSKSSFLNSTLKI